MIEVALALLAGFASISDVSAREIRAEEIVVQSILEGRKMVKLQGHAENGEICFLRVVDFSRGMYALTVGLDTSHLPIRDRLRPSHHHAVGLLNTLSEVETESVDDEPRVKYTGRTHAGAVDKRSVEIKFFHQRPVTAIGIRGQEKITCHFSIAIT